MRPTSFLLSLSLVAPVHAATVLDRARLGHAIEDITVVEHGPHAGHVVVLDGYEVFRLPLSGKSPVTKLFDLRDVGSPGHSNGIAWNEDEKAFAIIAGSEPDTLRLIDGQGRLITTRTIQYPDGPPSGPEGLTWIPGDAATFPGHLAAAVNYPGGDTRIVILNMAGEVVQEILPAAPAGGSYILGLEYLPPGRFLVTVIEGSERDSEVLTIDLAGNVLPERGRTTSMLSIEGVARRGNGEVLVVDLVAGILRTLDPSLRELPGRSLRHDFGVNQSALRGVSWDAAAERFVVAANPAFGPRSNALPFAVAQVTRSLDYAAVLSTVTTCSYSISRRLASLEGERKLAFASQNNPRAIVLLDEDGIVVEEVDVSALGRPQLVEFIEPTQQFAIRTAEGGARKLQIVSRTGSLVREIDFTAAGIGLQAVAFFNPGHPSGGQFLVAGPPGRVLETDFAGTVLREHDLRSDLGIRGIADFATITTGPQAGAFALVDSSNSELVVFSLD